jgi:hypothetical protein
LISSELVVSSARETEEELVRSIGDDMQKGERINREEWRVEEEAVTGAGERMVEASSTWCEHARRRSWVAAGAIRPSLV